MSGFIAVSVSLIGLFGVLFTLAIFIQMILSFPVMLSSNSQTYVQQQRKTYHISASHEPEFEDVEDEDVDAELEYEQEQEEVDDSVEKWIDVVDEAMSNSSLNPDVTQKSQGRRARGAIRMEPITRGRPRTRRWRTATTRPALRSKNTWQSDDQSDYDFETEQVPTHDKQHCHPAWRNSMAC